MPVNDPSAGSPFLPTIVDLLQQALSPEKVALTIALLPALVKAHPKLAYYEIPVISRSNSLLRWIIDNGMRGGIPDKEQRARTITLYLDKKPFLKTLEISSEDRIYILVVNKNGKVLWRTEGVASQEKLESLEAFLNAF